MPIKFTKTYCLSFSVEKIGLSKSVVESVLTIALVGHLEFIVDAENSHKYMPPFPVFPASCDRS